MQLLNTRHAPAAPAAGARRRLRCVAAAAGGGQQQPQPQPHVLRRQAILQRRRAISTSSSDGAQNGNGDAGVRERRKDASVTVFSSAPYLDAPLEAAGFGGLHLIQAPLDSSTARLAEGSQVACLFVNDIADAQVIRQLADGGVRLIAMRCAGYDRVDVAAAADAGIRVVRVPTYSPTSVAEHAVGLVFALNRHLAQAYTRVLAGNYNLTPLVGMELRGKTVAVVGTGAIGTEAARIFKGLGMRVLAHDLRPNPAVEEMGVPYHSLEEVLPQADVVSLHVPLLPSTRHLINQERVNMLKPGCLLVNTSRGGLVHNAALLDGLESGRLGGVGMDVYEKEASLFFSNWTDQDLNTRMRNWDRCFKLLTSYPQVIVTPHSAFLTVEALANIASTTVSNIDAFLAGQPLLNAVEPPAPAPPAADLRV